MATILSRTWTGADGDNWTTVGFEQVVGSQAAVVQTNAGWCGSVGQARAWLITGYSQTPNVLISCGLDWASATTAGRMCGLGARWSDDGLDGYSAEIDSNINVARARIRRRISGAYSDMTGWVDVSVAPYNITGAMLNAGVTASLRVEDVSGGVELTLKIGTTTLITHTDTNPTRLERWGRCGLTLDDLCTGSAIAFDNFTVADLEAEYAGTPADLDSGVALIVDGTYYAEADLISAKVSVGKIRRSLTQDATVDFTTPALMDATDGILYPGAVVEVQVDGTTVAFGRIQPSQRALQPGEGRVYSLLGVRGLAADIPIEDPTGLRKGANTIVWNLDSTHAEYDSGRADKEVGEAIKELLTGHDDDDTGLRAHLAAPPDYGTAVYVQAELDLLTAKVPGMSASGDVLSGVEQLLAFTGYALDISPATRIWHIIPRFGGTVQQVDLDTTHVLGSYQIDPSRNFTAAIVQGERAEITQTPVDNGVSIDGHTDVLGLSPAWEASLEATYSAEKATTNRAGGLVASIAGSVGAPTVTVDLVGPPAFVMVALEWQECEIRFTTGAEAGNAYDVTTNTGTVFTLVGPWLAGGPAAGNEFVVYGTAASGGRDNGHTEVGRKYEMDDLGLGIAADVCKKIEVITDTQKFVTKASVDTPDDLTKPATLTLDLPAIGLVNFTTDAHTEPCEAGGAIDEARVEVTLPTYDRTDPRVPMVWYPTASGRRGYTGTAYSFDSAKWAGGGRPGYGDVGVMRPYLLNMPEYDGSAAKLTEVTAVCTAVLGVLSPLARSIEVTVPDLELGIDVGDRLQLLGGPTELETVTDLDVLGVEWDPRAKTTTYYAGTQAAGDHDLESMRRAMVGRNAQRSIRRDLTRIQRIADCMHGNVQGAGFKGDAPPVQLCADAMTSGVTKPQRSVKEDLTEINLTIVGVLHNLGKTTDDETGEVLEPGSVVGPNGATYHNPDGSTTPLAPGATVPLEVADVAQNTLDGVLNNLGKTVDPVTGDVLDPGSVVGPNGGLWYDPDDPAGSPTPLAPGAVVPPTNEPPKGPTLGNLMKTEKPDGTIPEPGTALPDGGTHYGPGGSLPLPNGGHVPPSALSHVQADFRMKGMSVVTMQDEGGAVFETPDGNLWRAEALGYETGTYMRQVTAASGGAGTGENDGDYDRPVSELVLAPSEHVEFTHAEGDGFTADTPTDGLGLYLANGSTTSIVTDPIVLPSGAHGYDSGSVKVQVAVRGDTAGDGAGNFRFNVYGTWRPGGGAAETEVQAGSAQVVANPGTAGQTAVVEVTMPKPVDGTPGAGTQLEVRVERTGGHASDTATDRMCVLSVGADVPVQAPSVPTSGYAV